MWILSCILKLGWARYRRVSMAVVINVVVGDRSPDVSTTTEFGEKRVHLTRVPHSRANFKVSLVRSVRDCEALVAGKAFSNIFPNSHQSPNPPVSPSPLPLRNLLLFWF